MDRKQASSPSGNIKPLAIAGVFVILIASLYLIASSGGQGGLADRLVLPLLLFNGAALVYLIYAIVSRVWQLIGDLKHRRPGARLRRRLILAFLLLSMPVILVTYGFSLKMLDAGIQSWLQVDVEQSLDEALALAQLYLDQKSQQHLKELRLLSDRIKQVDETSLSGQLNTLLEISTASELSILKATGRTVASSVLDPGLNPSPPGSSALLTTLQTGSYVAIEPATQVRLQLRAMVLLPARIGQSYDARILQGIYPVPDSFASLSQQIEARYADFRNMGFLRNSLQYSFALILSLVVLYGFLLSVLAALDYGRRLFSPIVELANATGRIASGDYSTTINESGGDELGLLARSFNTMTRRLQAANRKSIADQERIETQKTYLETIIGRLSSAVAVVDDEGKITASNPALSELLRLNRPVQTGSYLLDALVDRPELLELAESIQQFLTDRKIREWRREIGLDCPEGKRLVRLRASRMESPAPGHMAIVLDDITDIVQAQRWDAWSEVARRFAHEIKNPLTPIQLAAERLRHRYLGKLPPEDADLLDRSTHTIVNQVESLKNMVSDFSSYAQKPREETQVTEAWKLIEEVVELYRQSTERSFELNLDTHIRMPLKPERIRQLLHNLILNADEAIGNHEGIIRIQLQPIQSNGQTGVLLEISDNGPGFPDSLKDKLFEPYATTKTRGTGLGLAIVRQVALEHKAQVSADNLADGGARIRISFPL